MVFPAYALPARPRVLVVDDHPDVLVLLARMLENAGFDVEEASSGRAAIELATNGRPFDVVVLDTNMGDVDGARVAGEIRASKDCRWPCPPASTPPRIECMTACRLRPSPPTGAGAGRICALSRSPSCSRPQQPRRAC